MTRYEDGDASYKDVKKVVFSMQAAGLGQAA